MEEIINFFLSLINKIIPKCNKIVFCSYPDFSDNAAAVFDYMVKNQLTNYKLVWLVDETKHIKYLSNFLYNCCGYDGIHVKIRVKAYRRKSLKGILSYITSKYVFYTHGIFGNIDSPNNQIIINLWHGMPLKSLGLLGEQKILRDSKDFCIPKFDYTIATSPLYQEIIAKVFGVEKEKVLVVGAPRTDKMIENSKVLTQLDIDSSKYNKIILWMPTYRVTDIDKYKEQGVLKDSGLPFFSKADLIEFNTCLRHYNNLLIIKLHPMDKLKRENLNQLSNIKVLDNEMLIQKGIHLYSLLGQVDLLLTDYSSVYLDFLLLNRPIGFLIDDIKEYEEDRGFIFENIEEWMPGEKMYNLGQVLEFIKNINNGFDVYMEQRRSVNEKVNSFNDFKNTERLIKFLKL